MFLHQFLELPHAQSSILVQVKALKNCLNLCSIQCFGHLETILSPFTTFTLLHLHELLLGDVAVLVHVQLLESHLCLASSVRKKLNLKEKITNNCQAQPKLSPNLSSGRNNTFYTTYMCLVYPN